MSVASLLSKIRKRRKNNKTRQEATDESQRDLAESIRAARDDMVARLQTIPRDQDAQTLLELIRSSSEAVLDRTDLESESDAQGYASALSSLQGPTKYWTSGGLKRRVRRTISRKPPPESLRACCASLRAAFSPLESASAETSPSDEVVSDNPSPGLAPSSSDYDQPLGALGIPRSMAFPSSLAESRDLEGVLKGWVEANPIPGVSDAGSNVVEVASELLDGSSWKEKVLEAAGQGLDFGATLADFIPSPFGSVIKTMCETGKNIVNSIQGIQENNEKALELKQQIFTFINLIRDFLLTTNGPNDPKIQDELIRQAIGGFSEHLIAISKDLENSTSGSTFWQAFNYRPHKDMLLRCEKQIRVATTAVQVSLGLATAGTVGRIESSISGMEIERLVELLGPPDNGAASKVADPEHLLCLEGTRGSTLEDIDNWLLDPAGEPIMWINGVAGCGKTAVAATVAHRYNKQDLAVAIFHFNFLDKQRNQMVVRSLARALYYSKVLSLKMPILSGVKMLRESPSEWISVQLEELILRPLGTLSDAERPVIIIFDGLDEWEAEQATALCQALRKARTGDVWKNVKVIITSLREPHLRKELNTSARIPVRELRLDDTSQEEVDGDLYAFLDRALSKIRSTYGLSESWGGPGDLQKLVSLAQGLFQWASTICRFIQAGDPEDNLAAVLELSGTSTHQLDKIYRLVLDRCATSDGADVPLISRVLGTLVTAPTPISLNTLASLENENNQDLTQVRRRLTNVVLSRLGALLIVPNDDDAPIRFLHSSIVDFLCSPSRFPESQLTVEVNRNTGRIASRCFTMMRQDLHCGLSAQDDDLEAPEGTTSNSQNPSPIPQSLQFVCQHWADYILALASEFNAPDVEEYNLKEHFKQFMKTGLIGWVEVMAYRKQLDHALASAALVETKFYLLIGDDPESFTLVELLRDVQRLIAAFHECLSESPFKFYHSLAGLLPDSSQLAAYYKQKLPASVEVIRGPQHQHWSCLWLTQHEDPIHSAAICPSRDALVTCGMHGPLRVWSLSTRKELGTPLDPTPASGDIHAVAFGPSRIVIAGTKKGVVLWKDVHRKEFRILAGSEDHDIRSVAISPDGCKVAAGSRKGWIILLEVETERILYTLEAHGWAVRTVAFSFDGMYIASGDGLDLLLWDASTLQRLKPEEQVTGPIAEVQAFTFSPVENTIAAVYKDDGIGLWDVGANAMRWYIKQPCLSNSVAVSPDGKLIAWGSRKDSSICLLNAATGVTAGIPLTGHSDYITTVHFISNATVVSGSNDGTIRMWDVSFSGEDPDKAIGEGESGMITAVAFSRDGRQLATASNVGVVCLWDSTTGRRCAEANHSESTQVRVEGKGLAFSPDGKWLCLGAIRGSITFLHAADLTIDGSTPKIHNGRVKSISFSPDGRTLLLSSDDRTVRLLDMETRLVAGFLFTNREHWPISASFSSTGNHIISLSSDGKVRVWNTRSGERVGPVLELNSHYLHDHTILWPAGDSFIMDGRFWNVRTGRYSAKVNPEAIALECLPLDSAISLWINESGWVRLGNKSLFWLPTSFRRKTTCHWHRGSGAIAMVAAHGELIILDVSKPLL